MIQKMTDEQIKTALLEGMTNQAAADKFGVGLRTFTRRKAKLTATGLIRRTTDFITTQLNSQLKVIQVYIGTKAKTIQALVKLSNGLKPTLLCLIRLKPQGLQCWH